LHRITLIGVAPGKTECQRGLGRNKTCAASGLEATPLLGDLSSPRVKTTMAEMKSDKEIGVLLEWNIPFEFSM
jgi:hypothetical protein